MHQKPWTLLSILVGIVGLVLFITHERLLGLMPPCHFHRLTGFLCPGCGGRRCVAMLLHGRWLDALHMNALVIFTGLGLLLLLVTQTLHEWKKSERSCVLSPRCGWIAVSTVLGFWLLRNVPWWPFTCLAPHDL